MTKEKKLAEEAAVRAEKKALRLEAVGKDKEARYARTWAEWWKGRAKAWATAEISLAEGIVAAATAEEENPNK